MSTDAPIDGAAKAVPLALLALLIGAASIGFAPIFVRYASAEGVGPVTSAFWRLALAAPLLLAWAWATRRSGRDGGTLRGRPWLPVLCGVFFAADLGFWHWSIQLTSVANSTLLANLNPVFVALAGFVLFRERFSGVFLAGLTLGMGGAAALVASSVEFAPQRLPGDMLGVATAVMYAGYFITAGRARAYYSTARVLATVAVTTACVLLPVALATESTLLPQSRDGWLPLFGLALVCQIFGQGMIIYALAHLPAAFSAVTLLIQPIVASLAAWRLFGEALGPLELGGAVLVLCGIVLARLGTR